MENKEVLIKVKNAEELIAELDYLLNEARDILKSFENKKELIEALKNAQSLKVEIDTLKKVYDDLNELKDELAFLLQYTNRYVEDLKEEVKKFEKHHSIIASILEQQTSKIHAFLVDEYNVVFKSIKQKLLNNTNEIVKRIRTLDKLLTEIYEEDYLKDITKIKSQLSLLTLFVFIMIVFNAFAFYSFNKKIDNIQATFNSILQATQ